MELVQEPELNWVIVKSVVPFAASKEVEKLPLPAETTFRVAVFPVEELGDPKL